jgi:4-hydroxy-3-polyprenylbenzoate decarboxylase
MNHLRSLREYVEALRAAGELQEIDVEVDWNLELGAIIRRSYELRAPAPLFNRIKGIEPGFRVLGAPAGVSRTRGLARLALSLGWPATATGRQLVEALAEAHQKPPIPPRRLPDGPCKENKCLGAAVDLERLPAPLIHQGDGGRYLNTWGTVIVQTPDRQWTNWSITRTMLSGKNAMTGLVLARQHLGMIYAQWKALRRPMPFALALGTAPAIPFVSAMPLDDYVNEADFVGAYLGEPVEVVDCETVDLQVPATAEIVLEGNVSVEETAPEGPMGEYSGYLNPGGGSAQPVFQVTAMTYRHQPILPVVAAGEPIEENHTCWGLAISAQVLWELRQHGFPVTACFCLLESAAHWLVVTVDKSYCGRTTAERLVRELAEVLFRSRAGGLMPKILLLDDDIDPANLDEVVWAFATRCHPQRGQFLFADQDVLPLVGFLSPAERQQRRTTKVIYHGLRLEDLPPEKLPLRSSFRYAWPRELQEKVIQNWRRYGYSDG